MKYRRADNSQAAVEFTTTNTTEIISGLQSNIEYKVKVRVKCPSGWSNYTAPIFLTPTSNGGGGGSHSGCGIVSDLEADNIEANQADISWTGYADAISYKVYYKIIGTPTWTTFSTVNTQVSLNGLLPNTDYRVKIKTHCPNGVTSFSPKEEFTTLSGNGNGGSGGGNGCNLNTIEFNLTLDDYGSETTWELYNDDLGNMVANGGAYQDGQSGDQINEIFCLEDGCYTIYVDDAYGDGICCDYGDGSFEILDINGSEVGSSDGYFGYYDYIEFCVIDNVANFGSQNKDKKETNLRRIAKSKKF